MLDRLESGKPRALAAVAATLLMGGGPGLGHGAPQTCADVLKSIEKRLADSGVRHPPLKIVPKNLASGYHVVASCEGGTQRIVHDADPASAPRDAGGQHAPPKSGAAKP